MLFAKAAFLYSLHAQEKMEIKKISAGQKYYISSNVNSRIEKVTKSSTTKLKKIN